MNFLFNMCHCVAIQVQLLCLGLNCKIIFRYLLNYILLTSNERVCTQIAHRQQADIPNIVIDRCLRQSLT